MILIERTSGPLLKAIKRFVSDIVRENSLIPSHYNSYTTVKVTKIMVLMRFGLRPGCPRKVKL